MTTQDLMIPAIISQVDKCYICHGILGNDKRHVTVNFRKDDGKFTLQYYIVCETCVAAHPYAVIMLGKGISLQLSQLKPSTN